MKKLKYLVSMFTLLIFLGCPQSPEIPEDDYFITLPDSGIGFVEPGNDNLLYLGGILLPTGIYKGQMLIDKDGIIVYIGRDAESQPEASDATKLTCAYGLAVPGFIDAWRHTTYAGGTLSSSFGTERFEHRHDWRLGLRGHTKIDYSNPDIQLWDEIGLIMTGTTTVMGTANTSGFVRNLTSGLYSEELFDNSDSNILDTFPLGDVVGNMSDVLGFDYPELPSWPKSANDITYSFIVSEGIDPEARNEFLTISNTDSVTNTTNIINETINVVHGIGLKAVDYKLMADAGTSLVWTPRSDLFLYGNTAMVTVFDTLGGNIALGSTWSITGSINTLLEIQTAAFFNKTYLNNYFSDLEIINMATINSARAFNVDGKIGSLDINRLADFSIFDTRDVSDYQAVFEADQSGITLVFREGKALYGDTYLIDELRSDTINSETIVIGDTTKRIYTIDEIGKTIAVLEGEAAASPLPLIYNASTLNTKIVPYRTGEYSGEISTSDNDGDGIENDVDNAPNIFNPIRPLDNGVQADSDGDGIGDVADPEPLL